MAAESKPMRADAARNRRNLLTAATEVFAERGMAAPLEHIARRAGVSIGTLYAHFPSRQALFEAIFPERLAVLDRIAEKSLADPDPWQGFVGFLEGLFALQAEDHGVNDALARRFPTQGELAESCHHGVGIAERIIARAKESGRLRADFETADLAALTWAMSQVIRELMDTPDAWRRCFAFIVDGLRAEAAHPIGGKVL